jgi:hypothetical protein
LEKREEIHSEIFGERTIFSKDLQAVEDGGSVPFSLIIFIAETPR